MNAKANPLLQDDDSIPRNEVKTRLTDREYAALQIVKQVHNIDSDSKALKKMARIGLFGVVGGEKARQEEEI